MSGIELEAAAALTLLAENPKENVQEIPNAYPALIPYLQELQTNLPTYKFQHRSFKALPESMQLDIANEIQSYDDVLLKRVSPDNAELRRHNLHLLVQATMNEPTMLLSFKALARPLTTN